MSELGGTPSRSCKAKLLSNLLSQFASKGTAVDSLGFSQGDAGSGCHPRILLPLVDFPFPSSLPLQPERHAAQSEAKMRDVIFAINITMDGCCDHTKQLCR